MCEKRIKKQNDTNKKMLLKQEISLEYYEEFRFHNGSNITEL